MRVQAEGDWWERNKARLVGLLVYAGWSGAKELVLAENGEGIHVITGRDGRTRTRWLKENAGEVVEAWLQQGRKVTFLPSSVKSRSGKPGIKGAEVL